MELMVFRSKKEMKPLLLKIGVALAISFAGFLVSHLRSRLRSQPKSPASGLGSEPGGKSATAGGGLKDELRILKSEESLAKIINGTSTTTTTTTTTTTFVGLSPTSKSSSDEEGFLLPEFNELIMKEFEISGRDPETMPSTPTPKKHEEIAMEQEIVHLRNLVWSLRERERNLELQLLEYYGLQEQEAAVRELESQLRINNVEAKFSTLKIESLEAENRRLHAQLSEQSRTASELEAARAKAKLLKRKLKSDGEQARERIAALIQRISVLQEREQKHGRDNAEVEKKLKRLKELEDEATNLRMLNSRLQQENIEFARKLESAQKLGSSVLQNREAKALEETERLREANDKMMKEIDQLRTDRCGDVEELVYLRWVNACLRYELRNYQAPPGKTVARDLNKNLSPKSEEKAKQLILEYAHSAGDEKSMGLMDFDSEDYPSSRASTGESEDNASSDVSTSKHSSSSKSKIFHKIKKLVLGKDSRRQRVSSTEKTPPTSCENSERRASISTCSYDEMIGRESYDSFSSSCTTEEQSPGNQLTGIDAQAEEQKHNKYGQRMSYSGSSVDIQRLKRLNMDEVKEGGVEHYSNVVGKFYSHKRMTPGEESLIGLGRNNLLDNEDADLPEKVELKKFAQVLKRSQPRLA